MNNEPVFQEKSLIKTAEELWKTLVFKIFTKFGHKISDEGINYFNYFIFTLVFTISSLKTFNIPKINRLVPVTIIIPLLWLLLFLTTESPFLNFIIRFYHLLLSQRDTRFRSIIEGNESEKSIRLILGNTKFTPQQYTDLISSLITQDKFSPKTQKAFIGAIQAVNADIRPVLKESFIQKNKSWHPSVISLYLFNSPKRYQKETEYLSKLLECYPFTSVGIAVGASQKPNIHEPIVNAGVLFQKSKYMSIRKALKIIVFISGFYIFGKGAESIQKIPIRSQTDQNLVGFTSLVWIIIIIFIFYKGYKYLNEKLISYRIKSILYGIQIEERDLDNIVEDFMEIF